jgi:hypothetical protein
MVAANLGSACIPFLGFSSALMPIGGGKFSQSHSTELFRFQSIPNEAMPELKVSASQVLLLLTGMSKLLTAAETPKWKTEVGQN